MGLMLSRQGTHQPLILRGHGFSLPGRNDRRLYSLLGNLCDGFVTLVFVLVTGAAREIVFKTRLLDFNGAACFVNADCYLSWKKIGRSVPDTVFFGHGCRNQVIEIILIDIDRAVLYYIAFHALNIQNIVIDNLARNLTGNEYDKVVPVFIKPSYSVVSIFK